MCTYIHTHTYTYIYTYVLDTYIRTYIHTEPQSMRDWSSPPTENFCRTTFIDPFAPFFCFLLDPNPRPNPNPKVRLNMLSMYTCMYTCMRVAGTNLRRLHLCSVCLFRKPLASYPLHLHTYTHTYIHTHTATNKKKSLSL